MPTATAPASASKSEQATQLRAELTTLTKDLAQTREKLEIASRSLGVLQDKWHRFTEEATAGKQPKVGAVATLTAEINEAQIPVEGLTRAVNEKSAKLDAVRITLENLEREIAIEAQAATRQARFEALRKQGIEAAAHITEKLRALIEEDLPAFDAVRDSLLREFIGGPFSTEIGPEINASRALMHELEGHFFDGSFLGVERRLLRQGWTVRGDLVFEIKNLRPPKQ